jgi:hypothetical protein
MRYVCSVIRFVPDPARGEYANAGLIVGSDETDEWDVHMVENRRRLRALGGSLTTLATFEDWLLQKLDVYDESSEEGAGPSPFSESWLSELAQTNSHTIQLSAPTTVAADSLNEAVESASEWLLVDVPTTRLGYYKRSRARADLRRAYASAGFRSGEELYTDVTLRIGDGLSEGLDFAVVNGRPVQLAQAWSFQIPDQRRLAVRLRSWAWSMSRLRQEGGSLRFGEAREETVEPNVEIDVVAVLPRVEEKDAKTTWSEALETFERVGAKWSPLEEVEAVPTRARSLLEVTGSDNSQ